ncbi:ATP-dependent Clp protease proteolytic subunit [Stutzerimonas sp. NM35]
MLHVIHFAGPINQGTASQLQNATLSAIAQGATQLRYHVSTDGGSTLYGFTLYNLIRSLSVPVTMHNIGSVESMGNILFLAADRRVAAPQSRFLLHPLNWGFSGGNVDHARLAEHAACLDNDFDRYVEIFHERTKDAGEPLDIRSCLKNTARVLTPSEATASGLVHAVEAPVMPGPTEAVSWWINA